MHRHFFSKPKYEPLVVNTGSRYHVFISDEQGFQRTRELLAAVANNCQCLLVTDSDLTGMSENCVKLEADHLQVYLEQQVVRFPAGSRFYLLGREAFIWKTYSALLALCIPRDQCAVERCGSIERDVFCVHCRVINSAVTHSPVCCEGCGRELYVYDHFSKRLGSYMGFQVNAECVAELPEKELLMS